MKRLEGKVAVVTGAAHGLGQASALRLAEEGARVVLGDIDEPALNATVQSIVDSGCEALGLVGDITEEGPATALIDAAIERWIF